MGFEKMNGMEYNIKSIRKSLEDYLVFLRYAKDLIKLYSGHEKRSIIRNTDTPQSVLGDYYSIKENFSTWDKRLLLYVASPSALLASLGLILFGLYPDLSNVAEITIPVCGLSFISCGIGVYETTKYLWNEKKIQR